MEIETDNPIHASNALNAPLSRTPAAPDQPDPTPTFGLGSFTAGISLLSLTPVDCRGLLDGARRVSWVLYGS